MDDVAARMGEQVSPRIRAVHSGHCNTRYLKTYNIRKNDHVAWHPHLYNHDLWFMWDHLMCEGGCSWRGAVHRDSRPSQRCCYKVCILWTSKFLCLVSLCFLVGVVYFDLLYHFFLFGLLCFLLFVGQSCFAMSDTCLLVWLDCFLWIVLQNCFVYIL